MAEPIGTLRRPVLSDKRAARETVSIKAADPCLRVALRAPRESVAAVSTALGVALPSRPKMSGSDGARSALWLGPDEWLVLDQAGNEMLPALAKVDDFHSAVDVSHRNVGIIVSGRGAADVINAGCPQDLSLAAFPVGACSRTLLGKIEIVLWRIAEDEFRIECWRSFADYADSLLRVAARDVSSS